MRKILVVALIVSATVASLDYLIATSLAQTQRATANPRQANATPSKSWTNICGLGVPGLDPPLKTLEPLEQYRGGLLYEFAFAFAIDSAEAMLQVSKGSRGGEFAKAMEANQDLLLSLSKKNPKQGLITFEEHKALLTVRRAIYVDAAVGLGDAYSRSKNRRFRDTYALHRLQLEAVAKKDWQTYKDWKTLKMDFAETDAVCEVLAAYLGKDKTTQ